MNARRGGAKPVRSGLLLGVLLSGPALAAESGGCGQFKWPIEADRALLLADPLRVESGATVAVGAPIAVRIALVDLDKAGFAVQPERPAAPGDPAGTLRFEAQGGTYQVTVSDRVWVDVAQSGRIVTPITVSGVRDCDGARKSVRYQLADGPATLQISGSPARTVAVAIRPAP